MTQLTITKKEYDEIVKISAINDNDHDLYDPEAEYKNIMGLIFYHGVKVIDDDGEDFVVERNVNEAGAWFERAHAADNTAAIHNLACYNALESDNSEVYNDLNTVASLAEGEDENLALIAEANRKTFCGSIYTGKELRAKDPDNVSDPIVLELVD